MPSLFGFAFSQREIAIFVILLTAIVLFLYARLAFSPWGKAMRAVRDSETAAQSVRSEEHTSELQSLMRISYAVFCLKKKTKSIINHEKRSTDKTNQIYNKATQTYHHTIKTKKL